LEEILAHWDINSSAEISELSDGLINSSWKVESEGEVHILQRINEKVFQAPHDLMTNHQIILDHVVSNQLEYQSPIWLAGRRAQSLFVFDNSQWRLGTFYTNTSSLHQVTDSDASWKVGCAFGAFDRALLGLTPTLLADTIPQFHDANRYVEELLIAKRNADPGRLQIAKNLIGDIDSYLHLLKLNFPKDRVIHNDAKISNLLFKEGEVFAVIDWDTTMGGHISWEYADLFRTTAIKVAEDHPDISAIELQYDLIEGLTVGYKSKIFDHLTADEKSSLYHGTLYIIFEQAVRFLKDYIEGDIYYKCDYDDHNFIRARNQFHLLSLLVKDKRKVIACIDRA